MRISDWSSDVCSSDLDAFNGIFRYIYWSSSRRRRDLHSRRLSGSIDSRSPPPAPPGLGGWRSLIGERQARPENARLTKLLRGNSESIIQRSEEHTSELQSLMRNSYAVFCLTKKTVTDFHVTKNTIIASHQSHTTK